MGRILALTLLALGAAAQAGTITCTALLDAPIAQWYQHVASCTLSATYAAGGDTFPNVGRDVCGSSQRLPVKVMVTAVAAITQGGATARAFSYDATANKVQCWLGAAGPLAECGAVDNSAIPLVVAAWCK